MTLGSTSPPTSRPTAPAPAATARPSRTHLSQRCSYDVGLQLQLPHLAQQRQPLLPLPALLARADPGIVAMTSGSNVAAHISQSSAEARCHCPPFSHALIPAL
ncbi:unnamed protein product [Prorocentrum cordatum]|uniref:Uncharacterized protein n=1 Tax=Prorocentrum cordatum TaxID=2364126 RepID=A0ABN9Q4H5_9DINO|nr:unnamed protein product [Polarella glacialis]